MFNKNDLHETTYRRYKLNTRFLFVSLKLSANLNKLPKIDIVRKIATYKDMDRDFGSTNGTTSVILYL